MNKNELIETVKAMVAAEALLAEIEDDVAPIAHTVEFFDSPLAVQIFGAEKAKVMAAHAREIQAQGAKWCDCPACAAGVKILENAAVLTA